MLKYCSHLGWFLREYFHSQESYDRPIATEVYFLGCPTPLYVRTLKAVEPSPPATELRELADNM